MIPIISNHTELPSAQCTETWDSYFNTQTPLCILEKAKIVVSIETINNEPLQLNYNDFIAELRLKFKRVANNDKSFDYNFIPSSTSLRTRS